MLPDSIQIERKRVWAVVVNYNSAPEICTLVASLVRMDQPLEKIVIIDNASTDDSPDRLRTELEGQPDIMLVFSKENGGFAAGVNQGIRLALDAGSDYVWVLNPDIVVEPDTLSKLLVPLAASAGRGAAGPKILYPDNRIWAAGGFIDFTQLVTVMRGHGEPDRGQFDEGGSCDYLPGCALLISSESLKQVGNLSEDYFLYFEETDWCHRAKQSGVPLFYVPAARVIHDFRDEKLSEPLVTYYYNRNRRLFFARHGGFAARLRLYSETLCRKYPEALRAMREAPDERSRSLFDAHRRSCADFLLGRLGHRHAEQVSESANR